MTKPDDLPDRGNHDGVDRHVAVLDPVELESCPSPRDACVFSMPMPGSRNHFHAVPVTMNDSAIG